MRRSSYGRVRALIRPRRFAPASPPLIACQSWRCVARRCVPTDPRPSWATVSAPPGVVPVVARIHRAHHQGRRCEGPIHDASSSSRRTRLFLHAESAICAPESLPARYVGEPIECRRCDVPDMKTHRAKTVKHGPGLYCRESFGGPRDVFARLLERIKNGRDERVHAGDRAGSHGSGSGSISSTVSLSESPRVVTNGMFCTFCIRISHGPRS